MVRLATVRCLRLLVVLCAAPADAVQGRNKALDLRRELDAQAQHELHGLASDASDASRQASMGEAAAAAASAAQLEQGVAQLEGLAGELSAAVDLLRLTDQLHVEQGDSARMERDASNPFTRYLETFDWKAHQGVHQEKAHETALASFAKHDVDEHVDPNADIVAPNAMQLAAPEASATSAQLVDSGDAPAIGTDKAGEAAIGHFPSQIALNSKVGTVSAGTAAGETQQAEPDWVVQEREAAAMEAAEAEAARARVEKTKANVPFYVMNYGALKKAQDDASAAGPDVSAIQETQGHRGGIHRAMQEFGSASRTLRSSLQGIVKGLFARSAPAGLNIESARNCTGEEDGCKTVCEWLGLRSAATEMSADDVKAGRLCPAFDVSLAAISQDSEASGNNGDEVRCVSERLHAVVGREEIDAGVQELSSCLKALSTATKSQYRPALALVRSTIHEWEAQEQVQSESQSVQASLHEALDRLRSLTPAPTAQALSQVVTDTQDCDKEQCRTLCRWLEISGGVHWPAQEALANGADEGCPLLDLAVAALPAQKEAVACASTSLHRNVTERALPAAAKELADCLGSLSVDANTTYATSLDLITREVSNYLTREVAERDTSEAVVAALQEMKRLRDASEDSDSAF